jgi:hypothetical protein
MSENKTKFVGRRQALKKILGGVGAIGLAKFAPETWAKPQLFLPVA